MRSQRLSTLAVLLMIAPCAVGQSQGDTSPGWLPAQVATGYGVELRYKIELTDMGWLLQFKNLSANEIHFGFYLEGIQESEAVITNGRLHIQSGKTAERRISWHGEAPTNMPRPRIEFLRNDLDEGPFVGD